MRESLFKPVSVHRYIFLSVVITRKLNLSERVARSSTTFYSLMYRINHLFLASS